MQMVKAMAPGAVIELPESGLYQVSLFPELMQANNQVEHMAGILERRGFIMPGSYQKPKAPNRAYAVIAIHMQDNMMWHRAEDVFSKIYYSSVTFIQDEAGYRAHTVMVQSCDEEAKQYYKYNDAEVHLRIRDRAKGALNLAEEAGILQSLLDRFEHMKKSFQLELD